MKSTIYALSLIMLAAFSSCRTKDGAPGPAGTSILQQQGVMDGTLSYKNKNGKMVSNSFDYQYYQFDLEENAFTYDTINPFYSITLTRYNSKDYLDNTFKLSFSGSYKNDTALAPTYMTMSFNLLKDNSNKLYIFQNNGNTTIYPTSQADGRSSYDITDFSFDRKTGQLSFKYKIAFNSSADINSNYDNSYTTTPTIEGIVNVKLKYNPYLSVM